jgi:hypothetical protein
MWLLRLLARTLGGWKRKPERPRAIHNSSSRALSGLSGSTRPMALASSPVQIRPLAISRTFSLGKWRPSATLSLSMRCTARKRWNIVPTVSVVLVLVFGPGLGPELPAVLPILLAPETPTLSEVIALKLAKAPVLVVAEALTLSEEAFIKLLAATIALLMIEPRSGDSRHKRHLNGRVARSSGLRNR